MPIYEYECAACGYRFERLIRNASTDTPDRCPKCGKPKPTKTFSAFSVGASEPESSPSCSTCPSDTCPYSGGEFDGDD
jgi:putative FmdB family regulatory protein